MALSSRARGALKLLALVVLLGGGVLGLRAAGLGGLFTAEGAGRLVELLRQSWWAPLAFVALYVVATALDFSGAVLTLAGGAVFGFVWGAVLNTIGANLGASAAFWVTRRLGREGLQAFLGARLGALDRVSAEQGFAWLLRLRLIPVVPFNLLNIAAGLTAMPWRTFAAATAIGILPATLIYTYFADALLSAGVSHEEALAKIARLSVALVALVLASLVPTIARRLGWLPLAFVLLVPRAAGAQAIPDHAAFTAILRDYVREGRVDYAALRRDSARLRAYLDKLAATDSGVLAAAPPATRLAFWINAYNACMLERVIGRYPIRSVRRIPGAFTAKHCRVAGAARSQDDIEHGIIRPMGEPRIHFVVNCAARSCPALATEAYAPEGLDAQLDAAVQRFVDNPRQLRLELAPRPTLWLNKVLDWYGGDFGGPAGVKRFFFRYLLAYSAAEVLRPDVRIEYFDYDWTLNDMAADHP